MTEVTESDQQMAGQSTDTFHNLDIDVYPDMVMLVRVMQLGGKPLPVCNFTE